MSCSEGCASNLAVPEEQGPLLATGVVAPDAEWKALLALLSREALGTTVKGLRVLKLYRRIEDALR